MKKMQKILYQKGFSGLFIMCVNAYHGCLANACFVTWYGGGAAASMTPFLGLFHHSRSIGLSCER